MQIDALMKHLTAEYVFGVVKKKKSGQDDWVTGLCPLHEDSRPSFSYNSRSLHWKCHAQCGSGGPLDFLMKLWKVPELPDCLRRIQQELNLTEKPKRKKPSPIPESVVKDFVAEIQKQPKIAAWLEERRSISPQVLAIRELGFSVMHRRVSLPVRDEKGNLVNIRLYTPRRGGKMIHYYVGEGDDKVSYGSPARLYGLDILARSKSEQIILAEGEFDSLVLESRGFTAVSSTHGCSTFLPSWVRWFKGRNVIVMYDCDDKGKEAVQKQILPKFAQAVRDKDVASLKVVTLPLKGTKEDKDITDWFKAGKSAEALQALIDASVFWEPERERRRIIVSNRQLRDVLEESKSALVEMNLEPDLFLRDTYMVCLRHSLNGREPRIEVVDPPWLHYRLSQCADWFRFTKEGDAKSVEPPQSTARCLLAMPPTLPVLDMVATVPVFCKNGNLLSANGYHKEEHLWLHLPAELNELQIPEKCEPSDLEKAKQLLLEPFCDFPFKTTADRCHAIALLLLPFVRPLIAGPTPLHLISAPGPGAGKSLLVLTIGMLTMGQELNPTTLPEQEEEVRKKLTSVLASGSPFVYLDNADPEHRGRTRITSSSLAAILTSRGWSDRLLGATRLLLLPNRSVWTMTANNPVLSKELTRRSVPVRIVPLVEQPHLRSGFRHYPLTTWAMEHRREIVLAALVLIRSWIEAGMPRSKKVLGSFEDWAGVVGGILEHVGFPDFLSNLMDLYDEMDSETAEVRSLIRAWWTDFKSREVSARELNLMCDDRNLVTSIRGSQSERSQQIRLGRLLGKMLDRVFLVEEGFEIQLQRRPSQRSSFFLRPTSVTKMKQSELSFEAESNVGNVAYVPNRVTSGAPHVPVSHKTPSVSPVQSTSSDITPSMSSMTPSAESRNAPPVSDEKEEGSLHMLGNEHMQHRQHCGNDNLGIVDKAPIEKGDWWFSAKQLWWARKDWEGDYKTDEGEEWQRLDEGLLKTLQKNIDTGDLNEEQKNQLRRTLDFGQKMLSVQNKLRENQEGESSHA